jgi:hypothetical protein
MSESLFLQSSIVSNAAPLGSLGRLSIWLYDSNDKLLLTVRPGEVSPAESFVATHVCVFMGVGAKKYFFPKKITVMPGDVIVFTPVLGGLKTVTVFSNGKQVDQFNLVSPSSGAADTSDSAVAAHSDTYMDKVLALAHVHALLGSTRDEFNADLKARAIADTAETKKLTKPQYDLINSANASIRLEGSSTEQTDQEIYDETAMLCDAVNTRLAAIANSAHPDQWDISIADNQIKMVNAAANGIFNWYYSHMGAYLTSINMSTTQTNNTYDTTTIQLDALVDIFKSLALPGDKLQELTGAVNSFVESMRNLTSQSSDKSLKNAKLTNFFSIQPPVGSPDLAKVAKMRMFYLQFNEETHEWSNSCSSGATYSLSTNLYTLDVEVNRQICHLTYDHNKDLVLKNAEVTFDDIGTAGVSETVPSVKTDGPSPIGP